MPKINVDTSRIPIWRLPPTRLEKPIEAYRAWRLLFSARETSRPDEPEILDVHLVSLAMTKFIWHGPVVRSDYPPLCLDDRIVRDHPWYSESRVSSVTATYESGIWAVKRALFVRRVVCELYDAPVYGLVGLWGRVVECEFSNPRGLLAAHCRKHSVTGKVVLYFNPGGYRGEYCMVRKLVIIRDMMPPLYKHRVQEVADRLSAKYGCPVKISRVPTPSSCI